MKTTTWKTLLLCLAISAVAACGSDGEDSDPSVPVCPDGANLCANIFVPDDYAGTPRQLTVGLFETATVAGPPADIAALIDTPKVSVEEPFYLVAEDIASEGDFYIFVALYNEGGGTFQPVPGVDHVFMTDAAFTFSGEPVDLGDIFLDVAE